VPHLSGPLPAVSTRALQVAGLLACLAAPSFAVEVAGISIPERARVGTSDLVLNGAGLRKKVLFKVYVASLYLPERKQTAAEVLGLGGPKRISVTLLRHVTARELVDALQAGVRANTSPREQAVLQGRLDELGDVLLGLDQGRKGDVIAFDWLPGVGTVVLMNGRVNGDPLPGDDLYRALLRVWLGERPTSAGLKKALLGQH
jgi:hypothetical protein